jgi:hypothetical protein
MILVGVAAAEALARLRATLPVDPGRLSDGQLVGFLAAVEEAVRAVDALKLAGAAELERRSGADAPDSLAKRLGFRSPAGALQGITKSSGKEAGRLVRELHDLAKLPAVEAAVLDARIGREAGAAIAGELKSAVPTAGTAELEAAQAELVELAVTAGADEVKAHAAEKAAALNVQVVEERAAKAMEERFFWIGPTVDGAARVSGSLPAGHAAVIRGVLDAFVNPKGKKTVTFQPEDEQCPTDSRTAGQRKADLLRDVFAAQARATEAPDMGGDHPTVWVSTTLAELATGEGLAYLAGTAEPVPVAEAEQAACTGGVQAVIFADDGGVLQLGHEVRAFTRRQRRAIALRDGGTCLIPGCDVPAQWCEVHHVIAHKDGGRTDVGNGVNLCWFHHHEIGSGPWRIRMRGGVPEVRYSYGGRTVDWRRAGGGVSVRLRAEAPPAPPPQG